VKAAPGPRLTLDHVALAVPHLEEALASLGRVFPGLPAPVEEVAGEKVRLSFLQVGATRLEVLEGTAPESPIRRFLEKGGKGVHHLSFRLEGMDLGEYCDELRRRGVEILGDGPRPGASGTRVLFLHPRSTAGVLVEVSQAWEERT
jgi:methylmalonyl-CoA/ethylmalonyl-CoA epimerase